jgi:regulator of nonsense transcripts 3
MPPKPMVLLAKKGANHADSSGQPQHSHSGKQNHQPKNTARLKLVVRRLPPALSKDEFLLTLGEDWKVPGNKIDWLDYRCGKTKPPGKLSSQSRAYLHLNNEQHVKPFEAHFLQLSFHDAKGSHKDPQLKHLLPSLAFAPNQRVPTLKQRHDGRQGTIDQDPEFIAFLERETQPVTKPLSLDQALAQEKPKDKVSSTPLLDDLREKKQNKARANQKHKDEKQSDKSSARGRDNKSDAKQPVKLLAKDKKNQPAQPVAPAPPPATTASGRKRERAAPNSNNIKSMLQRDLGLTPPTKGRGKDVSTANTSKTTSPAPAVEPANNAATAAPVKSTKSRSGRNKEKTAAQTTAQENSKPAAPAPTGILKKPAQAPAPKAPKAAKGNNTPALAPPSAPAPSTKQPKATANGGTSTTKAYLKHANASQGVTEALLLAALSTFGPVVKVEIDKRKGTALAEFKDNEGLKAAMSKKSVPVAQGAVEVLEYRDKQAQGGRNAQASNNTRGANGNTSNRGRGGRARGGAAAAGNTAAAPNGNGQAVATSGTKADAT